MTEKTYFPISKNKNDVPFVSVAEAWFWFVAAQKAKEDGARIKAGQSLYPRPCEPSDIYKVISRLHQNRRLQMEHFHVLRHYGVRQYAPNPRSEKEYRAYKLWNEAMERIEPVLIRKGIVEKPQSSFMEAAE